MTTNKQGQKDNSRRGIRTPFAVALAVLAALVCLILSEGDARVGAAHASETCDANPGDADYCSSRNCGPCGEGEGDCDDGQCRAGLVCVEEGSVDRCRPVGSGSSNLQVKLDGEWRGVCCNGSTPEVSGRDCWWTESDRTLKDESEDRELDCSERDLEDCRCDHSGERMHGVNGGINTSLRLPNGGPIFPDHGGGTCVYVKPNGELATGWTDSSCPDFRLR